MSPMTMDPTAPAPLLRTTLTPLPGGRVHQLIEWSNDDGRTWQTSFEGWYRRVGPVP